MVTSIDIAGVAAGRIRVAPSPLAELAAVLHLLAEPQHHPDLASAAASMAAAVPARLAAELDDVDRLDDERWVSGALAAHRAVSPAPRMWSPLRDPIARQRALASARPRGPRQAAWAERVLAAPAAERDRIRRVLLDCESAFFAATWQRVRPALAEEAERRRIDLARDGVHTLERISRAIRVDPERGLLTIDKLQDLTADGRAGVTLIPSVFGGPHLTLVYATGWQPVLQYPRPGHGQRPVLRVEELDARLTALAHPLRLRLCRTLARGAHTTGELAEFWALTPPEVSRHLAVLKAAGLLVSQRRGRYVTYRLDLDACAGLGLQLIDVIRR
jgi:DNA-binding transcriptional ArsR family regulator